MGESEGTVALVTGANMGRPGSGGKVPARLVSDTERESIRPELLEWQLLSPVARHLYG